MKIKTLDAWDRYSHFTSQSFDIGECCQDLIDKRPFGNHSFYIFAHARTDDDGVTKRLIWQPRLTKPKPQTNSMLFKWIHGTDNIKICWLIPARELWGQYKKGNITGHELTSWSIDQFENHRHELEKPDPDDLSESQVHHVYMELSQEARKKSNKSKILLG